MSATAEAVNLLRRRLVLQHQHSLRRRRPARILHQRRNISSPLVSSRREQPLSLSSIEGLTRVIGIREHDETIPTVTGGSSNNNIVAPTRFHSHHKPQPQQKHQQPPFRYPPNRSFHSTQWNSGRHNATGTGTDQNTNQKQRPRQIRRSFDKEAGKQLEAWNKGRQKDFLKCVRDYAQIWKDGDLSLATSTAATAASGSYAVDDASLPWHDLLQQFSHPSLADVTWEQILESEEAYAKLCTACHESLVDLGSISSRSESEEEADDAEDMTQESYMLSPLKRPVIPSQHNETDMEIIQNQRLVLAFWERIRNERTIMVEALQPVGYPPKEEDLPSEDTVNTEEPKIQLSLGKWIQSLVGAGSKDDELLPPTKKKYPLVEAHASPEFASGQYHYTRLIGRLFYRFPSQGLEAADWYRQRANQIQEVVDQATFRETEFLSQIRGTKVLSEKSLRLLVRAYCDSGTFEACRKAESVYHYHPSVGRHLLRFISYGYWQITKNTATLVEQYDKDLSNKSNLTNEELPEELKTALSEAAGATLSVVQLLMQPRLDAKNRNSLFTFGFHCLLNTPPPVLVDRYYELVEALMKRKFGRDATERLLSTTDDSSTARKFLRAKDYITLHHLILLYGRPPYRWLEQAYGGLRGGQEAESLRKAERLMEVLFDKYVVAELEDVMSQSTFDLLVQPRSRSRRRGTTRKGSLRDQHFAFAIKLVNRMVLTKPWWPTSEIWHSLFGLASDGPQVDQVLRKHELCSVITGEYALGRLTTTKYALDAWAKTSRRMAQNKASVEESYDGSPLPVERAWQLFQSLHTYSTPYFFGNDPQMVRHLYNPEDAPDHAVYLLVWQICAHCKSWETAWKVYKIAQEQRARGGLFFLSRTYAAFFRCLVHCPDEDQRRALAQQVFDEALENDQIGISLQGILKRSYPELYKQLEETQKLVGSDSDDSQEGSDSDADEDDRR